jgi:hypothetical protein
MLIGCSSKLIEKLTPNHPYDTFEEIELQNIIENNQVKFTFKTSSDHYNIIIIDPDTVNEIGLSTLLFETKKISDGVILMRENKEEYCIINDCRDKEILKNHGFKEIRYENGYIIGFT